MTKYISQEGLEQLKNKLAELKAKRKEISKRIEEAKSLGDLSENAEYMEAREAQAFNEGKIIELEQIIKESVIISRRKKDSVQVGSIVKVKTNSEIREFIIVSSEEVNPTQNKISYESPLGKVFMNKKAGDQVEAETPRGKIKYKIIEIK